MAPRSRPRPPAEPTWAVFDGLLAPSSGIELTWTPIDAWGQTAAEELREELARFRSCLAEWDSRLLHFGGEPSRRDWDSFRPLRLRREEDWSDWLAFLLQDATTPTFASHFLGPSLAPPGVSWTHPKVERERWTRDGKRKADLVFSWRSGGATCLEVKVDDPNLEKTKETAEGVGANFSGILLSEEMVARWGPLAEDDKWTQVRTWRDVAVALRKALWEGKETVAWCAWAVAFLGAIEEKILGLPRVEEGIYDEVSVSRGLTQRRRMTLLLEGSAHE